MLHEAARVSLREARIDGLTNVNLVCEVVPVRGIRQPLNEAMRLGLNARLVAHDSNDATGRWDRASAKRA